MHRFFVPPEFLLQEQVVLTGGQAHQIRRVLRMRPGDRIVLLDDRGTACDATIDAIDRDSVKATVTARTQPETEARTRLTLYLAILKGERFDWALQKGTEIGVHRFAPLICERNVVDDFSVATEKHERWERIVREAAEQSGRVRLPILMPAAPFAGAIGIGTKPDVGSAALRLICWERERSCTLGEALHACNFDGSQRIEVFVGPEGGFSEREMLMAQQAGLAPISLGARILRAETAAIVAATIVLHHAGDL